MRRRMDLEFRAHLTLPSVNVSPDAHSTPNMATMSPAAASEMSSSSLLCIRTSRGTCAQFAVLSLQGQSHNVSAHAKKHNTRDAAW